MQTFREWLSENDLNESTSKRGKLFDKVCDGKNMTSSKNISNYMWTSSNIKWACEVYKAKKLVLEQVLKWGANGFYELTIYSDPKYYDFDDVIVGKYELFSDALEVIEKNLIFVKNNFDNKTKVDIKNFS